MSQKRFQLGEVAEILSIPPQTVKTWAHRGVVISEVDGEPGIEGGRDTGTRRSFSIHAIMQMAIAKTMIDFGLRDTEMAFQAAAVFAHVGRGPSGWVGGEPDLSRIRLPGMPYHYSLGRTLLIVEKDRARVVLDKEAGEAAYSAALIVDVSEVFDQVYGRLMNITGNMDFHPSALMNAAYPEKSKA